MIKLTALLVTALSFSCLANADRAVLLVGTRISFKIVGADRFDAVRQKIEEAYASKVDQIEADHKADSDRAVNGSVAAAAKEYDLDLAAIERLEARFGETHQADRDRAEELRLKAVNPSDAEIDKLVSEADARRDDALAKARDDRDRRLEEECHYERLSESEKSRFLSELDLEEGPCQVIAVEYTKTAVVAFTHMRPYARYSAPTWTRFQYKRYSLAEHRRIQKIEAELHTKYTEETRKAVKEANRDHVKSVAASTPLAKVVTKNTTPKPVTPGPAKKTDDAVSGSDSTKPTGNVKPGAGIGTLGGAPKKPSGGEVKPTKPKPDPKAGTGSKGEKSNDKDTSKKKKKGDGG